MKAAQKVPRLHEQQSAHLLRVMCSKVHSVKVCHEYMHTRLHNRHPHIHIETLRLLFSHIMSSSYIGHHWQSCRWNNGFMARGFQSLKSNFTLNPLCLPPLAMAVAGGRHHVFWGYPSNRLSHACKCNSWRIAWRNFFKFGKKHPLGWT